MTAPQRQLRLREALTRRVGAKQIDDALWDILSGDEFCDPYAADSENLDRLERVYRKLTAIRRIRRTADRQPKSSFDARSDYERKRIVAYDSGLANSLASLEQVRELRASLGIDRGQYFSPGELLWSEAACQLPPEFFQLFDVPFLGHLSHIEKTASAAGSSDMVYTVWVEPPERTVTYMMPKAVGGVRSAIEVVVDTGTETFETWAYSPSALWLVAKTSKWLATLSPWTEGECAWFLLSGEPAARKVVTARLQRRVSSLHPFRQQNIVFEAPAWVSAETVLHAYRRLQAKALGGDRRGPGARNLEVYTFVETVTDLFDGERPSWRTLVQWWNALHPGEWSYDGALGPNAEVTMARDYRRAQTLIRRSGGQDWQNEEDIVIENDGDAEDLP